MNSSEQITKFLIKSIDSMIKYPRLWGTEEMIEVQFLRTMEAIYFIKTKSTSRFVYERYLLHVEQELKNPFNSLLSAYLKKTDSLGKFIPILKKVYESLIFEILQEGRPSHLHTFPSKDVQLRIVNPSYHDKGYIYSMIFFDVSYPENKREFSKLFFKEIGNFIEIENMPVATENIETFYEKKSKKKPFFDAFFEFKKESVFFKTYYLHTNKKINYYHIEWTLYKSNHMVECMESKSSFYLGICAQEENFNRIEKNLSHMPITEKNQVILCSFKEKPTTIDFRF